MQNVNKSKALRPSQLGYICRQLATYFFTSFIKNIKTTSNLFFHGFYKNHHNNYTTITQQLHSNYTAIKNER